MGGKGKQAKQRRIRAQIEQKKDGIVNELKALLQSRVVTDRMKREDAGLSMSDTAGMLACALTRQEFWETQPPCLGENYRRLDARKQVELSAEQRRALYEDIERYARGCWDGALDSMAMGKELIGTAMAEALADYWLGPTEFSRLPALRDIGIAARDLARLTVLMNAAEYLLEGHEDICHPTELIEIPDLSRKREAGKAALWLDATWRILINHADESDDGLIRQLGKARGCGKLAGQALDAIVSRHVAGLGLERGYIRIEGSMPEEQLVARVEYFTALYVVGNDYPLGTWPEERTREAQLFLRRKDLIEVRHDFLHQMHPDGITPAGKEIVERLRLVPKPF